MKKISITGVFCLSLLCVACQQDIIGNDAVSEPSDKTTAVTQDHQESNVVHNKIVVKIKPEYLSQLHLARTRAGGVAMGIKSVDKVLAQAKAGDIEPLFPVDQRFPKRHHEAGLDRWYVITLPTGTTAATRAHRQQTIMESDAIEYAGPIHYPKLVGNNNAVPLSANTRTDITPRAQAEAPYNDKLLPLQWHYNNTGERLGFKVGADIDLFQAWKQTTGSNRVIVDIVDGGVDVNHDDLRDNIWVNTAEKNGKPGVDDDGNGLVDDINGWNYIDNSGTLVPHIHGTHVAGTIGAMNNNQIGVCGIAGGNGTPNSGVKLMNTQIFKPGIGGQDRAAEETEFAKAIVYGADNGAVISQNSWGVNDPEDKLTDVAPVVKAAIDYFIKNAGCDDNGNQLATSPMKGGIVIFAAGNDGRDHKAYPGAYEKVVSVASMAPNFRRASYSTHGSWVTLSAPGGDETMLPNTVKAEYGVLSTLPNNKYGWLDGTSMACPHVSGVAALIVSKFGRQGFTCDDLKQLLINGTNDIYVENQDKLGKLGVGYIDADKALSVNQHQAPDAVHDLHVVSDVSRIKLTWNTATDPDDRFASWYYVVASETPFAQAVPDIKHPAPNVYIQKIRAVRGRAVEMQGESTLLPVGKHYYITVVSEDRWGNLSGLSNVVEATVQNGLPVVSMKELLKKIRITGTEEGMMTFYFSDPDHDPMTVSLEGDASTCTILPADSKKPGERMVRVNTGSLKAGKYKAAFVVTDSHKGVAKLPFEFEVYDNAAPVVSRPIDYVNVSFGDRKRVLLGRYFTDPDGHRISYRLSDAGDAHVADVKMGNGYLDIVGMQRGETDIRVHVEDTQKGVLEKTVRVVVSNDAYVYNVAPQETSDYVNVFLNENVKGLVRFTVYNAYGQKLLRKMVDAGHTEEIKIDVSELPAGAYIMHVEHAKFSRKYNIIKK